MNILILVGIFLLALIAIVAVVLLVMSERGAENSMENSAMMNPPAMLAADSGASARTGGEARRSRRATISLSPQEPDTATGMRAADAASTAAPVSSPMTRTLPSMKRESFPITEAQEEQDGSNLDGQFHELSAEIRALHSRAQEMEQRINMVMEIVDRLEHDHDGFLDISSDSED